MTFTAFTCYVPPMTFIAFTCYVPPMTFTAFTCYVPPMTFTAFTCYVPPMTFIAFTCYVPPMTLLHLHASACYHTSSDVYCIYLWLQLCCRYNQRLGVELVAEVNGDILIINEALVRERMAVFN